MPNPYDDFDDAPQSRALTGGDPRRPSEIRKTRNDAAASDYAPEQARTSLIKDKADIARDDRKERYDRQDKKFDHENTLREKFMADPRTVRFMKAMPGYTAALQTEPTPQGDMLLVYAAAKTMDPDGAVRGEDAEMVSNTDSIYGQTVARLSKELSDNGGTFRPKVRARIRKELRGLVDQHIAGHNEAREMYGKWAERNNLDPYNVIGENAGKAYADDVEAYAKQVRYMEARASGGSFERDGVTFEFDPKTGEEIPVIVGGSVGSPHQRPPSKADAFGRGLVNTLSLGFDDELTAGGEAFARALRGEGAFGDIYDQQLGNVRGERDQLANDPRTSGWYMGGQIGGAFTGGLGLGKLAMGATGKIGSALGARNALGADALYGAGYGFGSGESTGGRALGAVGGAAAGAGGNIIGTKLLGPAAQGVASGIRRGLGLTPAPQALNRAQQTVIGQANAGGLPAIRKGLQEAQDFGLPYTLADTSPQLRLLAGSAVRKAPGARELAEQVIDPRSLDQSGRLTQAINRDLGPTANVDETARNLTAKAKADSAPLYDQFYNEPPVPVSPKMLELFQTPAGKRAMARAQVIAANERAVFDPNNITPKELQYFKRGLDDVLEGSRDPVTGKIPYNEATRAVESVRKDFVSEADALYKSFAPARQAFAGPSSIRDALELGRDAPKMSPDSVNQALGRFAPPEADAFRLGYRSNLADRAADMRDTSNPWMAMTGAPSQRAKLGAVFPEGAPNLLRQAGLERNMGRTAHELLGGSPTAARQAMDATMDGGWGDAAGEAATSLLTGQAPMGVFRGLAQKGRDTLRVGMGTKRADEIARILLNPDPASNAGVLDKLAQMAAERAQWGRKYDEMARRAAVGGLLPLTGGF